MKWIATIKLDEQTIAVHFVEHDGATTTVDMVMPVRSRDKNRRAQGQALLRKMKQFGIMPSDCLFTSGSEEDAHNYFDIETYEMLFNDNLIELPVNQSA